MLMEMKLSSCSPIQPSSERSFILLLVLKKDCLTDFLGVSARFFPGDSAGGGAIVL